MKQRIQKNDQKIICKQQIDNPQKFENEKGAEVYSSYFYRNMKQKIDPSPSQSFQTNELSRTKNKLKQTRIRSKNKNCIYHQPDSKRKSQIQTLRQENDDLKKVIADLKISQLYKLDQNKIKNLLIQLDDLKAQVKKLGKQNQKLRIQNDFLSRCNQQIKMELNRINKKQVLINQYKQQQTYNNQMADRNKFPSEKYNMEVPEYMIFGTKRSDQRFTHQQNQTKTSFTALGRNKMKNSYFDYQKQIPLVRMSSQKFINPRLISQSKQKAVYTEVQRQNSEMPEKIR